MKVLKYSSKTSMGMIPKGFNSPLHEKLIQLMSCWKIRAFHTYFHSGNKCLALFSRVTKQMLLITWNRLQHRTFSSLVRMPFSESKGDEIFVVKRHVLITLFIQPFSFALTIFNGSQTSMYMTFWLGCVKSPVCENRYASRNRFILCL